MVSIHFSLKRTQSLVMDQKIYLEIPHNCLVLCNWNFDYFISADELFAKALQIFKACVLVNNNSCEKLFSTLESSTTFDESSKITSVPFFIPDFTLLSCELDNVTFIGLYWVVLYWYYIKVT